MNSLVAVLPATLLSCWDVLSDLPWFSCTCLQSALVHCRLGLPATKINLAYLYKALAFAHLYVPQSCYHKSFCLSTSGCTTSTSAILTFVLLHYSIHYRIACRNLFIHEFPQSRYISTTIRVFTNLVKAQLSSPTSYSPKPQDYNLLYPLLDDRFQEPLWIRNRIESTLFFNSISILVKSSFHVWNHFKLDQFRLRKALKSILDTGVMSQALGYPTYRLGLMVPVEMHNSCIYADVTWFGSHVVRVHSEQNAHGP